MGCVERDKGSSGKGRLHYGDGRDGYVHVTDDPIDADDSRKEISLDPMEKQDGWTGSSITANLVAVGTVSLSLSIRPGIVSSSMTKVFVMPLGQWYHKSKSSPTDMISFKVAPSSRGVLKNMRVDLLVEDHQRSFTVNFSSVNISSHALTAGTSGWTTVEIAISSFPILDSFTNL